jgi:hypothetical protein
MIAPAPAWSRSLSKADVQQGRSDRPRKRQRGSSCRADETSTVTDHAGDLNFSEMSRRRLHFRSVPGILQAQSRWLLLLPLLIGFFA